MKPFLKEQAERIHKTYPKLDVVTVVFPNRRAILYFKRHLGNLLSRPAFAPRLWTIEDFISSFSPYSIPDKLELVHRLHQVYQDVTRIEEPFEKFFFWGEMLLKDFDEVDKYCVPAEQLFKDLSHQKELDSSFDFLTYEQQKFLSEFWESFDQNISENKKKFLHVWRELSVIYAQFRAKLQSEALAYEGMAHRTVAERLTANEIKTDFTQGSLQFVGFNALTRAEELIVSYFVGQGVAQVYWDMDEYYVNNDRQEAGDFFRSYQKHASLGKTFQNDVPANFRSEKSIKVYGAAQLVGQSKLVAQLLKEELQRGIDPEDTLVVLPDERLLFPVLHGISGDVEKLNVSMGFPLSSTPMFNLVELLIELQINCRGDHFNHRQVLALLGHPYCVAADAGETQKKSKEIINGNWITVEGQFLRSGHELFHFIFNEAELNGIANYLKLVITTIGSLPSLSSMDKEYAFHFIKLLNRMEEVVVLYDQASLSRKNVFQSFLRLFRQLVRGTRIPFAGEPLKGLQIMGVLETRNLDFKNVFILSLNEGVFPSISSKGSYIPYNIRRAYELPTVEHQDAIYAYLFYRVLQRAENIFLIYNSETDVLGQGEMSRYLQQLIYESRLKIERNVLFTPIQPHAVEPIIIQKDDRVFDKLALYCRGQRQSKSLSPTAINDYIECRLRFYLKYIAQVREPKEVQEDLDARVLGNLLHKVMQLFYQHITVKKKSSVVDASDIAQAEKEIGRHIDTAFREEYGIKKQQVDYHGQRLVVKEVIESFVGRILVMDKMYAPFKVEALERKDIEITIPLETEGNPVVVLSGAIDRADSKGSVLRIIDYKTGRDDVEIKGKLSDLFIRDSNRNKAAFQTMFYALLYTSNFDTESMRVIPGLMNRINLFDEDFRFGLKVGKEYVHDIRSLLPEFREGLKTTLEELFDLQQPFDQTTRVEHCKICPYKSICYR